MDILFVNGTPALLIKREKVLVAGDLHIGAETRMKERGLYFSKAAARMAEDLLAAFKKSGARSIVLLGDIKDNVSYSSRDEAEAIGEFFSALRGMDISIARGNHDAYLARIFKGQNIDVKIEDEILLGNAALMHGNAWPSDEAMQKEYIITGHGHIAAKRGGKMEKAWLMAAIGSGAGERYGKFNKNARLIVAPAFNALITGTRINGKTKSFIPLLNKDVFDFNNAKVYDLGGNVLGNAKRLVEEEREEKAELD